MLPLLIAILIVYGFVLITVRGTILNIPRTAFFKLVANAEKWFSPTPEDITEMLIVGSNEIDKNYLEIYQRILTKLQESPDKVQEVAPLIRDLTNKIREHITKKRNKNIIKKTALFILQTIEKLWKCPMCLGFWVGLALCVLTMYVPISMFGISLVILSGGFGLTSVVSAFLLACMFAGTTWGIDQIIEFFSEIKDRFVWRQ